MLDSQQQQQRWCWDCDELRKPLWNILKVLINQPSSKPFRPSVCVCALDADEGRDDIVAPAEQVGPRDSAAGPPTRTYVSWAVWYCRAETRLLNQWGYFFFTEAVLTAPTKKQQSPQKCRTRGGNGWYIFLRRIQSRNDRVEFNAYLNQTAL